MILVEDRRSLADEINTAHKAGARLRAAMPKNTLTAMLKAHPCGRASLIIS